MFGHVSLQTSMHWLTSGGKCGGVKGDEEGRENRQSNTTECMDREEQAGHVQATIDNGDTLSLTKDNTIYVPIFILNILCLNVVVNTFLCTILLFHAINIMLDLQRKRIV